MEKQETGPAHEEQEACSAPDSSVVEEQPKESAPESKAAEGDVENSTDEEAAVGEEAPAASEGGTEVTDGNLQSTWTFWFSTKPKSAEEKFEDCLHKIGSFDSVSGFFNYYSHLKRPSSLCNGANISLFRDETKPMWESFPKGGCWSLQIKKRTGWLDRLWEQLLLGAIGEVFEDPNVAGVVVSIRSKENSLSVWLKDNQKTTRRFMVGEKLKEVLQLTPTTTIKFKNNSSSIKDRSSYRNGKVYVVPE